MNSELFLKSYYIFKCQFLKIILKVTVKRIKKIKIY